MRRDLLTALCEVAGPSGREERVRELVRPELESACTRVEMDPLGGLTGVREGRVVSDGPTPELLTSQRMSALFGCPVQVTTHNGHYHLFS